MLLQPLFLGISSLFGVVTQLGHRFVLFAVSPLVYNVGIIFGIVFLYPLIGLSGLAWGVVIGAFGHMLVQWPFVKRSRLSFSCTKHISRARMCEILLVSIPRALTLSLHQLVLLVFVSIASTMAVGSVSVFQFAFNLQSVPLAIIGVSYSIAAFPVLAELYAKNQYEKFNAYIISAFRHIIFWSFPVIALVIVLRAQVVRVVLGSGAFDWSDTRLTAAVLALFSISLLAQAVNLVTIRSFYAGGKTRIPFLAVLFGSTFSVVSTLYFLFLFNTSDAFASTLMSLMRVGGVVGSEVLVLGIGYTVGTIAQSMVLLYFLRKTFNVSLSWVWSRVFVGLTASLAAGVSAYATLNFVVEGINPATFMGIFIQGLIAGGVGILGAGLVYSLFESPELKEVTKAFQKKLFKTDVIAPERDII